MIRRLRARETFYEQALEKGRRSEVTAMRREQQRWRESEADFRTRGEYNDEDEDQSSTPA